jgi:hypothetical protein
MYSRMQMEWYPSGCIDQSLSKRDVPTASRSGRVPG